MSTEKRICTHPKRESRRSRARLLQERMLVDTNEGSGPAQRAYARGYTHNGALGTRVTSDRAMSYAWIIDVDHIGLATEPEGTNSNAKGLCGPGDAPDWMIEVLKRGTIGSGGTPPGWHVYGFNIYDDDGELYYSGRMITDDNPPDEEACGGPLDDFGAPNAGATEIRYVGHPEMNI